MKFVIVFYLSQPDSNCVAFVYSEFIVPNMKQYEKEIIAVEKFIKESIRREMSFEEVCAHMQSQDIAERVNDLKRKHKYEMYGLFNQATVGNVNTTRPRGIFDLQGKAKWDAWKAKEGMSKEDAKEAYIAKVRAHGFID